MAQDHKKHTQPCVTRIKKARALAKRMLRKDGDDNLPAGYRRGWIDALSWVLGENRTFDKNFSSNQSRVL